MTLVISKTWSINRISRFLPSINLKFSPFIGGKIKVLLNLKIIIAGRNIVKLERMERYTCSLSVDVTAPRLANLRSKYSTAPPKVARNPSRESAVLYSGLRRNSCNKIRKWILQLLDEKYRRRLHRAAYYLDTSPLRSSWNSVRFTTRNANRYLRIDTQLVELAKLMRGTRPCWSATFGWHSPPPPPPRGGRGIASHQLGKFGHDWSEFII